MYSTSKMKFHNIYIAHDYLQTNTTNYKYLNPTKLVQRLILSELWTEARKSPSIKMIFLVYKSVKRFSLFKITFCK